MSAPGAVPFAEILAAARDLVSEERFLNWQVAFPGVWSASGVVPKNVEKGGAALLALSL